MAKKLTCVEKLQRKLDKELAIYLCAACMPMSAGAISLTGSQKELEDFLSLSGWFGIEYDASSVKDSNSGAMRIMSSLFEDGGDCFNDMLYPGEKREIIRKSDPKGMWGQYSKISVNRMHWILRNIFNISSDNVSTLHDAFLSNKTSAYELNGYYYNSVGGVGGGYAARIMGTKEKGNLTLVNYQIMNIYDQKWNDAFAIMELKTINGVPYWTMHYNTRLQYGQNPLASGGFVDVPADSYVTAPVKWAVENGVTSGTGTATFSPDQACTRAQAVTFLWNAAGKPEPQSSYSPFTDVKPNDWYYKAVLWAVENNITGGTGNGRFSPSQTCTRSQIVTFLWRAKGQSFAANSGSFVDVPKGAYYESAVNWAVENGITTGAGNGRFNPNGTCTRGQIVTFLFRADSVQAGGIIASGYCGFRGHEGDMTWTLYTDGLMTVNGTGSTGDYEGMTKAPWDAYRSYIKRLVIGEGVTYIADGTFYDCTNMTSLTIPDSVTGMYQGAFAGCTSLVEINFGCGLENCSEAVFAWCTSLTKVTLPDSLGYVAPSMFNRCSGLKTVTIPTSVTSVGYAAFNECTNLSDIYYQGTEEQWKQVSIDNGAGRNQYFLNARVHFNS